MVRALAAGMGLETQDLGQAIAFAGLVLGAIAYYALIRWRQRRARDAEAAERSQSQERARRRFRHLERSDDV